MGTLSASSRERVLFAGSIATPPTSAVNDQTSIPSSRRNTRAIPPAATRAAVSLADARSSTFRTSEWPYFSAPARSACPGRTRVTGVARCLPLGRGSPKRGRLVVGQGRGLHDRAPVLPVAVRDEEEDRRPEGPSVADPGGDLRPVRLDRLPGAAAVALLAPREVHERSPAVSSSPAGTPSTVTPSVGPWDSPAVRKRNGSTCLPIGAGSAGRRSRGLVAGGLALGRPKAVGTRARQRLGHDLERRGPAPSTR